VKPEQQIRRPTLVPHARYRWDKIREQHQIVFPEGMLVINKTGAAIVQLCDGRPTEEMIAALLKKFSDGDPAGDAHEFLARLVRKGLLTDAADA